MKFDPDPDVKVLLPDGSQKSLLTYQLPSAILVLAALLLVVSMFQPYWSITMTAPQYPKGLTVEVYVNHLEGDMGDALDLALFVHHGVDRGHFPVDLLAEFGLSEIEAACQFADAEHIEPVGDEFVFDR